MINAVINNQWSWSGFGKSILMGAIGGAISGGYNPGIFSSAAGTLFNMAGQVISSILPSWEINIGDFNFSISPSIAIGKGWGFGANVSATFHAGDFSLSAGFGIMHYGAHAGSGEAGWEYRKSAMITYDDGKFGINLGTNDWTGLHEQRTGMIGLRHGDFRLMYENDGAPFNKLGKTLVNNTDMYRTATMRIGIGEFSVQTNLFTGKSGGDAGQPNNIDKESGRLRKGEKLGIWNNPEADMYRLGALTIGYKGWRVGTNSEYVRDVVQNWFAHTIISPQPGFRMLSKNWLPYIQYQTRNPYTLW